MNAILQNPAVLPSCTLIVRHRCRSDARGWLALAVAGLEWAALSVAALAFVAAGIAVWFG